MLQCLKPLKVFKYHTLKISKFYYLTSKRNSHDNMTALFCCVYRFISTSISFFCKDKFPTALSTNMQQLVLLKQHNSHLPWSSVANLRPCIKHSRIQAHVELCQLNSNNTEFLADRAARSTAALATSRPQTGQRWNKDKEHMLGKHFSCPNWFDLPMLTIRCWTRTFSKPKFITVPSLPYVITHQSKILKEMHSFWKRINNDALPAPTPRDIHLHCGQSTASNKSMKQ